MNRRHILQGAGVLALNAGAYALTRDRAARAATTKYELNLISDFKWSPAVTTASEIALLKQKGVWEPTTPDFQAVAGTSVLCPSFLDALGAILAKPVGSVDRVNIFTHGNPDLIAFKGRVQPGTLSSTVWFDNPDGDMTHLSPASLTAIRAPGTYFTVKGVNYTLDQVKQRFTAQAIIVLYSCKGGTSATFLQDIANTFRVMVVDGFKVKVAYCPHYTTTTIDRKWVALNDVADPCTKSATLSQSYYTLLPDGSNRGLVVSKSPQ